MVGLDQSRAFLDGVLDLAMMTGDLLELEACLRAQGVPPFRFVTSRWRFTWTGSALVIDPRGDASLADVRDAASVELELE